MMLMSSYVHYLKTFRIREGSFRDFLDSVSVEISEKQMQKNVNLIFFQPVNNK